MTKIDRLVSAMATFEGWIPVGPNPSDKGSLTYRFHNPCALRSSPFESHKRDGFAVFPTDMDGLWAAKWDIMQKARGNTVTGLTGESTLKELIEVWAPREAGNETDAYLQSVLTQTGFTATMKLSEFLP